MQKRITGQKAVKLRQATEELASYPRVRFVNTSAEHQAHFHPFASLASPPLNYAPSVNAEHWGLSKTLLATVTNSDRKEGKEREGESKAL